MPGLSLHRTENSVLVAELTMSALWRCSPCPGDSQGLSPRAGPLGAVLEGCGVLGIAGGCSHLVPAQAGLSLCNHHPSPVLVGAGHLWLISCCLHLHTWLLYRNGALHGYKLDPLILFSSGITSMSQLLGTARAAPSQAGTHTPSPNTRVWPPARPGRGQGEISGCRKDGGGPHDLEPRPFPPMRCSDGPFPP